MIDSFSGPDRYLSNYFESEVRGYDSWFTYPTVEHAFQAAKTHNADEVLAILSAKTPGEAKRLGRKVTLRPDWEDIKVEVMAGLLWDKFANNHLRSLLLKTGDQFLVEGNTWNDTFWGVCNGNGRNMLGHLLMETRARIRANDAYIQGELSV